MKPLYQTILGRNPNVVAPGVSGARAVVSHVLPKLGEHGFKWVVADVIVKEYGHYGFRLHPKANPVNVHVYGDSNIIQRMAVAGKPVVCELELVMKAVSSGCKFILVNLHLVKPFTPVTHVFNFVSVSKNCPLGVYTTLDMRGTGIKVAVSR